jgi:hypothetical protein
MGVLSKESKASRGERPNSLRKTWVGGGGGACENGGKKRKSARRKEKEKSEGKTEKTHPLHLLPFHSRRRIKNPRKHLPISRWQHRRLNRHTLRQLDVQPLIPLDQSRKALRGALVETVDCGGVGGVEVEFEVNGEG